MTRGSIGAHRIHLEVAGANIAQRYQGIALFGGSFPLRALVTLVYKARMLLRKNAPGITGIFATEAEARAWLDARRRVARG